MKWGLQHVKVTLEESESGETIVIEQSSDGRVTCEHEKTAKPERAANAAPSAARARKAEAPAERPIQAKTEERKRGGEAPRTEEKPKPGKAEGKQAKAEGKQAKAEDKPAKAASSKKPAAKRKTPPARARPRRSLEWAPCVDHEYTGFAARSDAGRFKVLITKGSQWALFYEMKDVWPQNLGCFRKVKKAQARAQELHDAGWPETEFGPVTAGQIARACPAPQGADADDEQTDDEHTDEEPEMETAPKATPKPDPKPEKKPQADPKPAPPSKTEADTDKELLGSLTSELENMLDEDDDD